jgi:acyl-CoA dehydrogenase
VGLADVDVRFAAVVLEEAMNAGRPDVALSLAMHDSFALPLLNGRKAALAAVVEGELRAEPTGGGWRLSGTAQGVVNGLGADVLVVRAIADGESDLLFAVAGRDVDRVPAELILGLDDLDVADLRLDGLVVTEPLSGDLGAARARHQLALAVAALAGARAALRMTVAYVQERKAFGTPIATFENTRHVLGALGARVAAVEAFVDSVLAAAAAGAGVSAGTAAAAKLTATEVLGAAVDQGVQLHGGYGYMWEYPIARAYTAARFFRLHGGSTADLDAVLAPAVGL